MDIDTGISHIRQLILLLQRLKLIRFTNTRVNHLHLVDDFQKKVPNLSSMKIFFSVALSQARNHYSEIMMPDDTRLG